MRKYYENPSHVSEILGTIFSTAGTIMGGLGAAASFVPIAQMAAPALLIGGALATAAGEISHASDEKRAHL